jgi:flagellar hook-length control protein FliK
LHGARDATVAAKTTTNSTNATPQPDAQNPKDLPRDKQAVADDGALPVTTTAVAAPAAQPQAAPASAVKVDLSERAPEITPTAAASAQALASPAPAANRNVPAAVTQLERLMQPVGTPAWNDGLANRVVWMARNDVQTASIQLNPPNLGPVEIKVTVVSDPGAPTSATVQFSAAHSATRDAIESSMPRLHDALRESGITLGNTSVDSGNAGQARQQAESGRQSPGHGARADLGGETFADAAIQPRSTPLVRGGTGLVDTFA